MKTGKDKAKRRLVLVCTFAIAVALSLSLTACGKSDKENIRKALDDQFEGFLAGTDESLNAIVDAFIKEAESSVSGVERDAFYESWIEGFSWSIDDITVEKDTAVASITITHKSLDETRALFDAESDVYKADLESIVADDPLETRKMPDSEEVLEKLGVIFMESLDKTSLSQTSFELAYRKSRNMWIPTEASAQNMFVTLFS